MINWHLEKRHLKDLIPHPKNPRQLSKDQERHLRTSLDKFGVAEKIIINTDNTIIGGHQRVNVLKSMKEKEIDCWVPERDLDEKEVEELMIRLNRNHGEFDYDVLANVFDVPCLMDWGFSPNELELDYSDVETEETITKTKALKTCPKCGHEF